MIKNRHIKYEILTSLGSQRTFFPLRIQSGICRNYFMEKKMNKEQRSPHGDNQESGHLPIYGVGPYYGVGIILLTLTGIVLSAAGVLDSGKIINTVLMVIMIFLGILLLVEGFLVWKSAAIGKNCVDNYIKK